MITSKKTDFTPVKGIDTREPQTGGVASVIVNGAYNSETQTWSSDVGYEKYFTLEPEFLPFAAASVDSVYNFDRHNGAQQWLLFEQDGDLSYVKGNDQTAVLLKSGRTVPANGEAGSSYNTFGRYAIITNGLDAPLKYRGYSNIQSLGWERAPSTPSIHVIAPAWSSNTSRLASTPATSNFDTANVSLLPTTYDLPDQQGLGSATLNEDNSYRYRVTLTNEAGSESPISPESDTIAWTTTTDTLGNDNTQCLYLHSLPVGSVGTVARTIYRTKNLFGDGIAGNYYYVDTIPNNYQTSYIDSKSDAELGSLAPNDADSITFPASQCRWSSTFKNCLFVDGGSADGSKLFYSQPFQPDTYRAAGIIDFGSRKGGSITGLFTYYNNLLVFRDNAIDVITGNSVTGFNTAPWVQGIGTRSPHTITFVPGVGVLFFGNDGIYAVTGGLDGGAVLAITRISDGISSFIEKASSDIMGKACATYSSALKEWQCYFPAYGTKDRMLGVVFHVEKAYWSIREGFDVGCITTDFSGNIVWGNNARNGITVPILPNPFGTEQREWGLFVMSKRRTLGTLWLSAGPQDPAVLIDNTPPVFKWRSQWHDFGYPAIKKFVKYLYIYAASRGNNKVPLSYFKDHSWNNVTDHPPQEWQWDDNLRQSVFGITTAEPQVVILDSGQRWEDKAMTPIRFDISNKALSDFAWEIETTEQVELVGYAIEYEVNGTQTIGGRR